MRYPSVVLFSSTICVASLVLSGCSSSLMSPGSNPVSASGSGPVPAVVAVGDQVNGVAPNRKQEVQFSEAMDPATINAQSFQVTDSSGKPASGIVSYDPDFETASFLPNPPLQTNASYTATITTAVASTGGMHLASTYTYAFATRADTDTSPLLVNSVDPIANATCVSATHPITITFDEAPDPATLTSNNLIVSGPNGTIATSISANVATTQVMLTPASALPSGTINVRVSNIGDLAGVPMAAPYTWNFSTACSAGGGGTGGASIQYRAPIRGTTGNGGSGQVTVDTAGNVSIQLHGAAANTTFAADFCPPYLPGQNHPTCFSIGTVNTNANGEGSLAAKFPKSGSWVGDFNLNSGPLGPGFSYDYGTDLGPDYFSTLQPIKTENGAVYSTFADIPQAPLTSGTVTYSSSPAPNGSFQFTLTGAPANTRFEFSEGGLAPVVYQLMDSQGNSNFTSDSQGNLTVTVLASTHGGIILEGGPVYNGSSQFGYQGGFSVP